MDEKYTNEPIDEKPPLDFSNPQINPNLPDLQSQITQSVVPSSNIPQHNSNSNSTETKPKKNRTLQFYQFLFYSIKLEIKIHEFLSVTSFSNVAEIVLWILSLILYIATPSDFPKISEGQAKVKYKNAFIWLHIIHLVRGVLGLVVYYKIPKTHEAVEAMKNYSNERLERSLFNDLAREAINEKGLKLLKGKKLVIYVYAGLTFFNFIFDVVDFIVVLSSLDRATSDAKVVLLTYLMIAFLYVIIDLVYLFWGGTLVYYFPPKYLAPLSDAFSGSVLNVIRRFKVEKPKTDVVKEAKGEDGGVVVGGNEQNVNVNVQLPMMKDQIIESGIGGEHNGMQQQQHHQHVVDVDNDERIDI